MNQRSFHILLLAAFALSCDASSREELSAGARPRDNESNGVRLQPLPCLHPDSAIGSSVPLVYSDFSMDAEETGDISGTRLFLHRVKGVWSGKYQYAEGEWGLQQDGLIVAYNDSTSALSLRIPHGAGLPDTTRFVGHLTCDSIFGRQVVYPGLPDEPAIYKREPSAR